MSQDFLDMQYELHVTFLISTYSWKIMLLVQE